MTDTQPDTQPDALEYAIGLASRGFVAEASELRRLHSLNQELLKALKEISAIENQEWGADWEEIEQATLQMQQSLKPKGQTMTDTITLPRSVVEQALLALRIDDLALVRESVVALRAALEQPVEQEPVAWLHSGGNSQPLYLHPKPPRQPLTKEEIAVIAAACGGLASDFVVSITSAIEVAHGIGGKK